jgi:predicted GH43/DUF377 family glycosyl hydrolase
MRTAQPIPVVRGEDRLLPDPRRVVARPHVAASREVYRDGASQAKLLLERLLAIPEPEVSQLLDDIRSRYASRHRAFDRALEQHYEVATADLPEGVQVSPERRLLIGAYFTMEYAVESAALFNPSIVPAADQSGLPAGSCRFVLSLRAVGEGHISSIEFRTGIVGRDGRIALDPASPLAQTGQRSFPRFSRRHVRARAIELGADRHVCARLLDHLPHRFRAEDLDRAVEHLESSTRINRALAFETVKLVRLVTASNYTIVFDPQSDLSERVLVPAGPRETEGMEDARFVRFVDDRGAATYYATYTAFDGFSVLPQLIETPDFERFRICTLSGRYARNKGLALFPRRIGGRYAMLSRYDQQGLHLMYSEDVRAWNEAEPLLQPRRPWGVVRVGNCGSPIETPEGWLVLTHGVGPVREYTLGAALLDLEDPGQVIGELDEPLLAPDDSEREGYVPNVVYTCGAMIHGGHLVLPYGFADRGTRFATVELAALLDRLRGRPKVRPGR